jgi:WD40 repeat protein
VVGVLTLLFQPGSANARAQERATLEGTGWIYQVVYSPDGKWLACAGNAGSDNHAVRVWEAATNKEVARLKGPLGGVALVAFSPDGKTLAATGLGRPVRLYDTATWQLRAEVPGKYPETRCVAFSPDGKVLAASTFDGGVLFWDAASLKPLPAPEGKVQSLGTLAFSPDAKLLAGGGFGRAVIWDLATGKLRDDLQGHKKLVCCVAFAPDGKALATVEEGVGATRNLVLVWDAATGKRKYQLNIGERFVYLQGAAFSPDSKTVAVVGVGPVLLFDVGTNIEVADFQKAEIGHCVAFSPDGRTLAVGMRDGTVRLFDVPKGKEKGKADNQ